MSTQPNILLITSDQQRFDTIGDDAPSFLRTPHTTNMLREGIQFTRAYADAPLCGPSRVTIMTGKHAFTHGMFDNGNTSDFIDRTKSLPGLLNQAGYQTAAIGKMHFEPQRARHGFQEMIIPEDYYREMSQSGHNLQPMRHGLGQNEVYPGMATVPESQTLTSWTAERCVDYIRERRDTTMPFFLWCSFTKPHPPYDPPEPYYSMYRNSPIPEPVLSEWSTDENCPETIKRFRQQQGYDLVPPEVIKEARSAYYGLITQIDYNIGRIFSALQDKNLFNETLIIYASDHGDYLGDHRTAAKGQFHESSAHVPFVVRLPKSWDNRQHDTQVDTPVSLADILPTIVSAAGGTVPSEVDGSDLIAMARREK